MEQLLPGKKGSWDPGGRSTIQVLDESLVATTVKAISAAAERQANDPDGTGARTELDSHANMPVVGNQAFILGHSGKRVDVSPFSPDYKPLEAELVELRDGPSQCHPRTLNEQQSDTSIHHEGGWDYC